MYPASSGCLWPEPRARNAKPRQGRLSRLHDNLVVALDGENVQRASAVHDARGTPANSLKVGPSARLSPSLG